MAEPSRTRSASEEPPTRAHVLVVEARFYDPIMDLLLDGVRTALDAAGATFDLHTVPGALEVAPAVAIVLDARGERTAHGYDAVVALGCVMRGETYHFEIVSNESARGLSDLSIRHALPIGNAILTVENEQQALVRADPLRGNKGGEAVEAALALVRLKRRVQATS